MKKTFILCSLCFIITFGQISVSDNLNLPNITTDDSLSIVKLQLVNPEMIGLAGEKLQSFRSMFYKGFFLSLSGCIIGSLGISAGIEKSKEPNMGMVFFGGIVALTGTIIELISFSKIGEAGILLKKSIEK